MPIIFQENFTGFTATGFAPTPGAGQLDSDLWRVVGQSDSPLNPAYGFTATSGDFARGVITGSADPTGGGVYATNASTPTFGAALVLQPSGNDFDVGGFIELRIQNTTGSTLTSFTVDFDWVFRNNADRASVLAFSFSGNGSSFTTVPDGAFTTPQALQVGATFVGDNNSGMTLTGLSVNAGDYLYLRWTHVNAVAGSGSRDEVGIDNVVVSATPPGAGPQVTINDVSVTEGDGGTKILTFTVTRTGPSDAFTVNYGTADGSASAGSDYVATSGTLSFAAGETTKIVEVTINGDTIVEGNETFLLNLSGATGGATIADGQGQGTITNDDIAVTISDVTVAEGNTGTATATFTVTRSGAAGAFSVNFGTADGSASAGSDYVATSGTLNFAAADVSKTITVTVNGDFADEPNETFFVNLSVATGGATIADSQGQGTITNDDVPAPLIAPWINEFHYDNSGTDAGEFIEVAGLAGTDLTGYTLILYNGDGGAAYNTRALSGIISNQLNGYGTLSFTYPSNGIQNGSPDGIALVGPNGVIEFISYEGPMPAISGPAIGLTSMDVGVVEDGSANGTSIARVGDGVAGAEFHWVLQGAQSSGAVNAGQTFAAITPRLHVSDATVSEGDLGTKLLTFTVTRYGANGAFTVDYAAADGSASAGSDYVATSGTLSFADGEKTKTVTVTVNGDTTPEQNETLFLNLTNAAGSGALIVDGQGQGTINNDDIQVLKIYEIQGAGHTSPYNGQQVRTQGIVTSIDTTGGKGFWIQDPTGDGNDATSDAVFVFTGADPTVAIGQLVSVEGHVNELKGSNANDLTVTEIESPVIAVISSGNPLPAATILGTGGRLVPTEVIDNDNFGVFDPAQDAIDFYESLEGMRVTVPDAQAVAPTVGNTTWIVANQGANATGMNSVGGITIGPGDLNPERVQIFFDSGVGAAGVKPTAATGDHLGDVTGILSYFGGDYELLPTAIGSTGSGTPVLPRETTTLHGDGDHITIGAFNVENLDPFDPPEKINALAGNIVSNLGAPDIVGLEEVQDADGAGGGTNYSGQPSAQKLIDAIILQGGPHYVYVEVAPTANNTTGGENNGNIRQGYLYNPDRVGFVSVSQILDTTPLNGDAYNNTRKPLVGVFTFHGETITLIDVHNTSRGGSDALFGVHQPAVNAGDDRRLDQTSFVKSYVEALVAANPTAKVMVLGDFNAFQFEASLTQLESGGALTNLTNLLPSIERFSYNFDGNSQQLDHMLASPGLLGGAQFDIVHLNSNQAEVNQTTDHDGSVARLLVNSAPVAFADSFAASEDTQLVVDAAHGLTANDTDVNGDALSALLDQGPAHGVLALAANGSFTYTPAANFNGADSFTYLVRDPSGAVSAVRTVTLDVAAVNDAPVANPDTADVNEDETVVIDVLANDTDVDVGDSKTLVSASSASGSGVSIVNGQIVYAADADVFDLLTDGQTASDTLTYVMRDLAGLTSTSTVTVTVHGVPDGRTQIGGNGADTLTGTSADERVEGSNGSDVLSGEDGADTLIGGNGSDTLAGGAGADRLDGGLGPDTFVFGVGFGHDRVTDFSGEDHLRFDHALFADFAAVLAHSTQVGADVVITFDAANSVVLQGVQLGSLHANDFLFV